jgi:hypothetical protein
MLHDWEIWLDHNIASIVGKWLKEDFDLRVKSAISSQMQMFPDLFLSESKRSWQDYYCFKRFRY